MKLVINKGHFGIGEVAAPGGLAQAQPVTGHVLLVRNAAVLQEDGTTLEQDEDILLCFNSPQGAMELQNAINLIVLKMVGMIPTGLSKGNTDEETTTETTAEQGQELAATDDEREVGSGDRQNLSDPEPSERVEREGGGVEVGSQQDEGGIAKEV